jgi:hypothetical protein
MAVVSAHEEATTVMSGHEAGTRAANGKAWTRAMSGAVTTEVRRRNVPAAMSTAVTARTTVVSAASESVGRR